MHIEIGDVRSLSVENWRVTPDDRQTVIQMMDGSVVQDFGHQVSGDKIGCTAVFSASGWEKVRDYWENRTPVAIQDEAGVVWPSMRIVVKDYSYVKHFPRYYRVTLEFWRI